jgi:hypothetical protein
MSRYGALSRADNETQVCDDCGLEEAIEALHLGAPTPKSKWPINLLNEPRP